MIVAVAEDRGSWTEADAEAFQRTHTEPEWPQWFSPPRGWSVYDEVPELSDLQ